MSAISDVVNIGSLALAKYCNISSSDTVGSLPAIDRLFFLYHHIITGLSVVLLQSILAHLLVGAVQLSTLGLIALLTGQQGQLRDS